MANIGQQDPNHAIVQAFDLASESLKTTLVNADVNINVSAFTDSIKIGDGSGTNTSITTVGGKQALDVNVADITLDYTNDSVTARNIEELVFLDEADATTTYLGNAAPGSSQASSLWKIKRILVIGTVTQISYADGNSNYDNVWNNRASLSFN